MRAARSLLARSHGGESRIPFARFPVCKSPKEVDLDHARGPQRDAIARRGTLDFVTARRHCKNRVLLPGSLVLTTTGRRKTTPGDRARHPRLDIGSLFLLRFSGFNAWSRLTMQVVGQDRRIASKPINARSETGTEN